MAQLIHAYECMAATNVVLTGTVGLDVPGCTLLDALRVKQVLANGLTNALKHTVTGSVHLEVDGVMMPDGRPGLLFQVVDSGPGLGGVDYRQLFDPSSEFGAFNLKVSAQP